MSEKSRSNAGIDQITMYKDALILVIRKYIPSGEIYLFGSRAMGTERSYSDIDLVVKTTDKIDHRILNRINEDIETLNIPFFVDVVDYNAVYDGMKNFIDKTGILWSK